MFWARSKGRGWGRTERKGRATEGGRSPQSDIKRKRKKEERGNVGTSPGGAEGKGYVSFRKRKKREGVLGKKALVN